jgi:hypothetical protein
VEVESLELETLHVELQGQATLHVQQLSLQGVRCVIEPSGGISLRCDSARAGSLAAEQSGRSLQQQGVAWPNGFELQGDSLRWRELTLERLQLAFPELPRGRSSSPPPPSPSTERPPLDLPLLDHLEGLLALDLFVDVQIPILPDRRATHSIRVPITQGAINFKELERCLAGLEDALFDFEVTKEGLIFELDPIPGLTIDNTTLVSWPLAGHDHLLADKQQKVRLRRLLDYRLSPKLAGSREQQKPRSDGPSPLRRLRVSNIATVLRLGGPVEQPLRGLGMLRLGAPGEPAAGELKLSGELEHTPGKPASATELRLDVRDLLLGASIADHGRRAEIERLGIGAIDSARLSLLGVEPRSLRLDAARLRLAGVELRGWFPSSRSA